MSTEPIPRSQRAIPEKPSVDGLEAKWVAAWQDQGTYRFDRTASREDVFSIDTPPPTVSGSLHVGHVFSYTHTDTVARYQRMAGKAVFYPMGWDDNGLPTERRVENFFGVRCDPSVPYEPGFEPPETPPKERRDFAAISRRNFIELCHRLTEVDEQAFAEIWTHLGLSVDWNHQYATIDERSQRASQRAFLRNLARGEAYTQDAPSLWDITYRTAVAQAELEDRERPGAFHTLAFHRTAGADTGGTSDTPGSGGAAGGTDEVLIDTTRPELLAACVALVAHPDDERYQPLFGTTVTTPVFGVEVPVLAHELADPEKGTGIAMICTFGDTTDVTWWRELQLPTRAIVDRDGRIIAEPPPGVDSPEARDAYATLAGKTLHGAQQQVVELLAATGDLRGEPRKITHNVKFYERGDRPLEIVATRQWYIRNGGREADLRQQLLKRGAELNWVPPYMRARYENWVEGLNGDWLISRQRFFGVPIPVWYPLDQAGEPDYDHPISPDESTLPVDPASHIPPGYTEDQRDQPGGFVGDPDVMDTWATSSLTPQIATGWEEDADLFARTFPMDLRPQGHDIIRTWLFSTVVRAHFEHGTTPWRNVALSGWILDPDRKKMSKSKGNVVTPMALLEQYGSDGVRYWASNGRPGTDTAFDEKEMKVGRRLAIKLLNASRFVLSFSEREGDGAVAASGAPITPPITEALDRAMLADLATLVDDCTTAFDGFDYARVLERTEAFFWAFCDDHVELVKGRAYGAQGPAPAASAVASLELALSTVLRLFAPVLPFVTEEIWSWWMEGSVHTTTWPKSSAIVAALGGTTETTSTTTTPSGAASPPDGPLLRRVASDVLSELRRAKSDAKLSMRTRVSHAVVRDTPERLAALDVVRADVAEAGNVAELATEEAESFSVDATLEHPAPETG